MRVIGRYFYAAMLGVIYSHDYVVKKLRDLESIEIAKDRQRRGTT